MRMKDRSAYLEQRVKHLTDEARLSKSALEMATSLGSYEASLNNLEDPGIILRETAVKVRSLVSFRAVAFYLVDEKDSSFVPAYCDTPSMIGFVRREMDQFFEDRTFAWALGRNKPVIVGSSSDDCSIMLHALSTTSRTRGMFVGVMEQSEESLYDTLLSLLTIILISCAHMLESFELYRQYRLANENLEKQVGDRTRDLAESNTRLLEEVAERIRAEDRLKQAHADLEERVRERTRDLDEANIRLRRSGEEMRKLAAYIQDRIEEERSRLAREVHDELGQNLTALKMGLSRLPKLVPAGADTATEKIDSLMGIIDQSIMTVRKITGELRPVQLDDLGLVAAVQWYVRQFTAVTGIPVTCSIEPENIDLDKERNTALYRVFQESLTNVARHARASSVRVDLRETGDGVELAVRDNGVGIAKKSLEDPSSFGLMGMRERVIAIGGKMIVSGRPGKGTDVRVLCPGGRLSGKGGVRVKFLIVDDHTVVRRGIMEILADFSDQASFDEANTAREALVKLGGGEYDMVLLDISLPDGSGLDVLKELRREGSEMPVLILSMHPEEDYAIWAFRAGADGYLTKSSASAELVNAARKILEGGKYVSPGLAGQLAEELSKPRKYDKPHRLLSGREHFVSCALARGSSSKDIAAELGVSAKTVSTYKTRAMKKLRVDNTAQLVRYVLENRMLEQ